MMNGIQIKNNRILYYGNTAGYIEKGKAIVDPLFQNEELRSYLEGKKDWSLSGETAPTQGWRRESLIRKATCRFLKNAGSTG